MPVRGTLLTYWGLYFPPASATETPANLSNLDADMASIFGKETPPPKHGRVWEGRGAEAVAQTPWCKPHRRGGGRV